MADIPENYFITCNNDPRANLDLYFFEKASFQVSTLCFFCSASRLKVWKTSCLNSSLYVDLMESWALPI